ncbi:MAG: permease-like cell division protein FtsX [Gammaproteobacteria bacterium]|nr:permease-like cell division protein FtsX [Gammaproteobacteria bacterium]MBU1978125.1 permease-like cell division protein FtsX [Gammaproteobacteria bacterium]
MNWLSQHRLALGLILDRFVRAPFSSLLAMIVFGVTLSLPLGLYTLIENVKAVADNVSLEPQITVFMSIGADADSTRQVESRLKGRNTIMQFHFIPRDRALQELLQSTGLVDVAAGLERNPLPDAFVIEPKNINPGELEKLRKDLTKLPKVDKVLLDTAWAERLNAMVRLGRDVTLILATLLGFALVVITSNTIRLQILSQREEIEVSTLIGATDAFIRRPFLYHGALQGLGGGIAAWLIVSLGLQLLNVGIADLAKLYTAQFRLLPLGSVDILSLLLFSSLLGWLGAFLAVGRHLRRIEPRA